MVLVSCFRDSTGPGAARRGHLAFAPVFDTRALRVVAFDRVRILLVRTAGGEVAKDTVVPFPSTADSILLGLTVPVQGQSEIFSLSLAMITSAGDTVFCGGPSPVTLAVGVSTNQVSIPVRYCGVGSVAAGVRFVTAPAAAFFGDTAVFAAEAFDSGGKTIAGTPILYSVNPQDILLAGVPDPAVGRVVAKAQRGAARVIAALLTGQTATVTLNVQPKASALAITGGNAQSGPVGGALAQPLSVRVTAADGLGVQNVAVAFAVTAGGGSLSQGTATTDVNGIASASWTLGPSAGANTATATVAGIAPVTFTATGTAGVATQIAANGGNGQSAPAGTAVTTPPSVIVRDVNNNPVSGVSVTFAVATGGGTVVPTSALTTNASGIAQVTSWTLGATAGANALTASSGSLTPVVFTATGTAVSPLIQMILPGGAIGVGSTVPLGIKLGQAAPAAGVTVTITSDSTQYVTVAAPGTVAFAQGDTLKTINVTGVAYGGSLLHATATGYTAGLIGVAVTPNLIVLGQSVTVAVGQTASVSIQVIPAAPGGGLTVTLASTDTTKVKVTTPTVTIPAGQTNGTATVQGVAAGIVGITATAPSYVMGGTVVTAGVAGQPALLTKVAGDLQSALAGAAVPIQPAVKVTDILGAKVVGATVTFAVVTGGGSITGGSAVTDTGGVARVGSWTLGTTAGANALMASLGTLTPVVFTATGSASGIASTAVTPHAQTLNALTQTFQLVAQAKDPGGNNVSGSFTWVSRTPSVATVNAATGLVTTAANGTSWVVATEAGGTKDSALITVAQTLASINVTPGNRSIYLTRNFKFTAQGVDGMNVPVPGNTAFTWSTTAPAVATVDTTGYVVGVGLGTAQIKATSGTITGVVNVSVITPIKRIAVVVDTVGAAQTDTFSMVSLGLTRRYRAIAHDTLDAVMTGIGFTWVSTNGSVAQLQSFANDTANVVSAANGVTTINATAQGFTSNPGALLTVSQVLASVVLTPPANNPTATIAITGTVGLVARGKDANNRFISGGSFTFASATPAVATVDAITGIVTGVTNGTSDITAKSGTITSNALTVTVGGTVSFIISFARDTLSVGRGSSTSVPILLSRPSATGAPLTVNLTATAYAHWSPAFVVIAAGLTSANATLVGDSAGTTTVTASDGSSQGYSTASAVARVTANMRLTSGGYSINTTDIVTTQVLLSDPSPAGGTFVTFSYSTPGIARVSPDPAFIPAGQLAADIQILAAGAGSTNVTPVAIGVNGAASSFTAYAPVLTLSTGFIRLGQGQYEPGVYVYTPTNTYSALPVTFASSDTTVVTVTPSVTIPANSNYAYFTSSAIGLGTATVTASAPGWAAAGILTVTSTTPHVGICCGGSLYTTSPQQNVTVYSEDSVKSGHYRTNSLVVRLSSTDTTVLRLLDTVVTIAPSQYYTSAARVIPGGLGGTAYIRATASGHTPDSTQYTVLGPPLSLSWGTNRIGAGQQDYNLYVYTPNNVTAPLVVTLANPDSTILGVPTTVTILTGTNYVYFNVRGKAPGSVTLTATATGFQSATASYIVTTPRVTACCSSTFNNFSTGSNITFYSTDSLGSAHYRTAPLTVSIVSTDPAVVSVDSSTVTIDSGTYSNGRAHVTPVGVGTARIIFAASGQTVLDTLTMTVVTPPIYFSIGTALVGRRQHFDPSGNGFYVYTPNNRASPVAVTITQKHGTVDSLTSTTPTIPANGNYVYVDAYGLSTGTDTLTVTAPGYLPSTAYITVTTPKFTNCCMPGSTTTTNPPIGITVYATDSAGGGHYTMDTVVVAAVSSDATVLQPVQPFFRILKNAANASTTVNVVGPGTASITYSDSAGTGYGPTTTGSITVTGPSLAISNGTTVLGMRQSGGPNSAYVYTPNNVATPLVVNLLSTGTRVVTVPASVTIPVNTNYAYFQITAQDTVGTIQIQATATGYSAASTNVQVTQPKFVVSASTQLNTTSPSQNITVNATDANGTAHYTTENVVVTLASSAVTVASIDSGTVTIPSGAYSVNTPRWSPGIVGTARFTASDQRAAQYKYNDGIVDVSVVTPSLTFASMPGAIGIGQYQDYAYVYTPDNAAAALAVAFTHTGTARTGTFTNLTNTPITGVTINTGTNYTYFRISGLVRGTDTLTGSATVPAHNPVTVYTVVDSGRVDPIGGWPGTIKAGDSVLVTLYARDPNTNVRPVVAATQYTLTPNAIIEFRSGGTVITNVTIASDQQSVQFYLKGVQAGTGSVTITSPNYKTYTNTVTVTS